MTAILYRNNVAEVTRQSVPKPTRPTPIDRAKRGLTTKDWYSTEKGTLVEVNEAYDSATHIQTVLTYDLSNGVLTVTYDVQPIDPMVLWARDMANSDSQMSRDVEDLWDVVGITSAPQAVKDKYSSKKTVRSQRPA